MPKIEPAVWAAMRARVGDGAWSDEKFDRIVKRVQDAMDMGEIEPYDFLEYNFPQMIQEELDDADYYGLLQEVAEELTTRPH